MKTKKMKTKIKANKIFCDEFKAEMPIEHCINLCPFYTRTIHLNKKDFIYCQIKRRKS